MILKWFALKNKISSGWTCVSDNELMGWVNSCPIIFTIAIGWWRAPLPHPPTHPPELGQAIKDFFHWFLLSLSMQCTGWLVLKAFTTRRQFTQHTNKLHKKLTCVICGMKVSSQMALKKHKKSTRCALPIQESRPIEDSPFFNPDDPPVGVMEF